MSPSPAAQGAASPTATRPNRNDPCPCGSGRKYKRCCLQAATSSDAAARLKQLFDQAAAHLARRQFADAVPLLRKLLALEPGLVPAHNNLGIAYKEQGQLEAAEAAYRAALHLDPRYAPAQHNLGELLYARGQLTQARVSFEAALQLDAQLPQTRLSLANLLVDLGENQEAVGHCRELIKLRPHLSAAYLSLGIGLKQLGSVEAAIEAFRRAVETAPTSPAAHYDLGRMLLESGRFEAAKGAFQRAMELRQPFVQARLAHATAVAATGALDTALEQVRAAVSPGDSSSPWALLGRMLAEAGALELARECYRRRLELAPADRSAQYLLSAMEGMSPERAPDEYVRTLFDGYAASFDSELVKGLAYTLPREMVETLRAIHQAADRSWDVLDLGCGTGLVGVELARHSRSVVGVDLSTRMLERAAERGVYGRLVCANLEDGLAAEAAGSFDVVTAADVLIYIGRVDGLMAAVRRVLRPGGHLAFSAEAAEDISPAPSEASASGYVLQPTGRYAHSANYLREAAAQSGFSIKVIRNTTSRREGTKRVPTWLLICTPAHGAA